MSFSWPRPEIAPSVLVTSGEREPRAFDVRVHTELASVGATWRVLEATGRCTPFQRLDWVTAIIRDLAEPADADVFIVELIDKSDQGPVMLLPLLRTKWRGFCTITWLSCEVCDYAAPLLASNAHWSEADAASAWRTLCRTLQADMIRFDRLPALIGGATNPLTLLKRRRPSALTTCGLAIDGDPKTVLERCCSRSFVRRLGKTGRRLERRGTLRFIEARTPAEIEMIFAALLEQRFARFRKLGRFDLLSRPDVSTFYRNAALEGLKGGSVRLLGLQCGDEWVGTYYGVQHGGAYQGLIVTMADERWKTCSPGLHVHAHVIKWARAQGLDYFDMSIGPLGYKDVIGGRRTQLYAIDEALSSRGRAYLLVLNAVGFVKSCAQRFPQTYDFLRRLRDEWLARKENSRAP